MKIKLRKDGGKVAFEIDLQDGSKPFKKEVSAERATQLGQILVGLGAIKKVEIELEY